jgi:hypothetical protein
LATYRNGGMAMRAGMDLRRTDLRGKRGSDVIESVEDCEAKKALARASSWL